MKIRRSLRIWSVIFVAIGAMNIPECQAQRSKRARMERSPTQTLVYDNHSYLPSIKTVQFHKKDAESSIPIMNLGDQEVLKLSFDDLRGDIRNFYFSIEHCTADWESSGLSPLEYADGFNEDRIIDYRSSSGTLQAYTHYTLDFPSAQVRPKLAGNYLLKVYEDADKRRLVVTQRVYVLQPAFQLSAQLLPSYQNTLRASHQKLDLTVLTSMPVNDPLRDVKIRVLQNQRTDVAQKMGQPSYFDAQTLQYKDQKTLDFPGGAEFRTLDLRSFRLASESIANLGTDSLTWVRLHEDSYRKGQSYGSFTDANGAFFIRNMDRNDADTDASLAATESDYAWVTFTLKEDTQNPLGERYVVGLFNHYQAREENRMHYHPETKRWEARLLLKQGVYDYQYLAVSEDGMRQVGEVDGDHFQTGNDYHIFSYYRRPGTTWDTLVGYYLISN